jgi:hypothetical protein
MSLLPTKRSGWELRFFPRKGWISLWIIHSFFCGRRGLHQVWPDLRTLRNEREKIIHRLKLLMMVRMENIEL